MLRRRKSAGRDSERESRKGVPQLGFSMRGDRLLEYIIENNDLGNDPGSELYRRFLSGDGDAFTELVGLYEDEFYRFIYTIVKDHHEVKHIVIDAFAMLAVGGGKFTGKSSIKTYLFAIGKNLAYKSMRKRREEQHIDYETIVNIVADESTEPDSIVEREESKREILRAMNSLKDDYRKVLLFLYFEDLSYMEVGQIMNKSVNQTRVLAHRAKAALKKKLESDGFMFN